MLSQIVERKMEELGEARIKYPLRELKAMVRDAPPVRCLLQALGSAPEGNTAPFKIIAEIKKASPSRGVIKQEMDPKDIAAQYERNGATAVSVLTEHNYFLGDLTHMRSAREACTLPILRKDFILDEYQLYEARAWGADSFLLIASIVEINQMTELFFTAMEIGMHPIIEVHNEDDLQKALTTPGRLLGINNRDLNTLKTDISTTLNLISFVPDSWLVVSESGIRSRDDLEKLTNAGVRAFLIGELLMAEKRPGDKLKELLSPAP